MAVRMQALPRPGHAVSALESAFATLLGKQPNEQQKQDLYRTRAGILGAAIAVALVGWWSYRQGANAGQARGWVEAHRLAADERAAASWANTPEGRLAYALALAGSLRDLATCSGRGWLQKETKCFPMPQNGFVYGWQLPSGEYSAPNARPRTRTPVKAK